MNDIMTRAIELKEEMVRNRRRLHSRPELGLSLPETSRFVEERLEEMGCAPQRLGESGVTALIGKRPGKTLLLRADMDALPMKEESGLEFASETEAAAHCCGHDLHTAMLLGAARILKEREADLCGQVKLLFQPGEETGQGALEMIRAGALEQPRPQGIFALHVNAKAPAGALGYGMGCAFSSNDSFQIRIHGRGGHGARPHETIDPIRTAVHIYHALEGLRAGEISPMEPVVLSVTAINGGSSCNVLPDSASLSGTLRAYSEAVRQKVKKRIGELAESIAASFGAQAQVEFLNSLPPVYCSPSFTDELLGYAAQTVGAGRIASEPEVKIGSEDFAFLAEQCPENSAYFFLGAGPNEREGFPWGQHSARVVFNEDVLPLGAAVFAACALGWLGNGR